MWAPPFVYSDEPARRHGDASNRRVASSEDRAPAGGWNIAISRVRKRHRDSGVRFTAERFPRAPNRFRRVQKNKTTKISITPASRSTIYGRVVD